MVVDSIKNIERYENIHPNISTALHFIAEHEEDPELEDGRYELIPDEVIVYVLSKESHYREEAEMEIHKKFMDIHYMICEAERCGIAPLPKESEIDYSDETDNGFWKCEDTYNVRIGKGEFYAVWPMEPHCPLCNAGEQKETVRKIICKVKVD